MIFFFEISFGRLLDDQYLKSTIKILNWNIELIEMLGRLLITKKLARRQYWLRTSTLNALSIYKEWLCKKPFIFSWKWLLVNIFINKIFNILWFHKLILETDWNVLDFDSEEHFTGDPIKFNVALEGGDYLAGNSEYALTTQVWKKIYSEHLFENLEFVNVDKFRKCFILVQQSK